MRNLVVTKSILIHLQTIAYVIMNYLFRDQTQFLQNVILNRTSTNKKKPGYFCKSRNNRELFFLVNCRAYFKLSGKFFGNSLAAQAITLSLFAPQSRTKVMVANSSITSVGYAGPASR